MALYTVYKGKRYRATITLGYFQRLASNETVADKFREVCFAEVEVSGSGPQSIGQRAVAARGRDCRNP